MMAHRVGMDVLIRVDSPPLGLHWPVGGVVVFTGSRSTCREEVILPLRPLQRIRCFQFVAVLFAVLIR